MSEGLKVQPDLDFIRAIKAYGGEDLKKCYQCASCSVACELSPNDKPFPRKEIIWANWGFKDKLMSDPDVWLCFQCNDCSNICPRGVKPGNVLSAVRNYTFAQFAFPSFMGKALSSPKALLPLLLVPAVIMLVIIFAIHGGSFDYMNNSVEYGEFFPHKYLESFFISGNILIFAFAAIGLFRFWSGLKHSAGRDGGPGFIQSVITVGIEIFSHKKFFKCDVNRPRAMAHLLLFGGFVGAFITTGIVVLVMLGHNFFNIPAELSHPIFEVPHPVKILGIISGIAMTVGGIMLLSRRLSDGDNVGTDGYADRLFLNMIILTAVTGLLTYIARLIDIAMIAYPIYYIHLVIVFFLLWYMPYSKFAHMLYRTLALIWARSASRN